MMKQEQSTFLQNLIKDYERDLRGNIYTFRLSDGETIVLEIRKENVPHLLGIGRLPLRQIHGKYQSQVYAMLRDGVITLDHVVKSPNHKEVYKKIMNFEHLVTILHCGDAVKVVRHIGTLKSKYLLYLDRSPDDIIHLGVGQGDAGNWFPESLLVLNRNVTGYIDNQISVDILDFSVSSRK